MIGGAIGHYRITSKLGEGGMGEVYRATDTRLGREVAIKVLPQQVSADPDRMARFEREARVLASLNHPGIAAIYGVEAGALVMELIEGTDLSGPLSPDKVLAIARQLTDALDYAHERGVIHRDLKPANIKITPDGAIKILDFGLAKIADPDVPPTTGDPALSPTLTVRATEAGLIMGTAAYMAPEQARGQAVDKRADIWAVGVILYELLTGRMLFEGETISDTLAEVLKKDIDLQKLPPGTAAELRGLVTRCLERDRRLRLRDLGEAWVEPARTETPKPRTSWIPWAAAGLFAGVAAVAWLMPPQAVQKPFVQLEINAGPGAVSRPAFSPDGSTLAYTTGGKLFVRRLDEPASREIAGISGASDPFFSPDGGWIGYHARSQMHRVPVQGGTPLLIADSVVYPRGAWWASDGYVYLGTNTLGTLLRVKEGGGTLEPAGPYHGNIGCVQMLPGGRYLLASVAGGLSLIEVGGPLKKTLVERAGCGQYLPSGHLLYLQNDSLFGVSFDSRTHTVSGTPVMLAQGIREFVASQTGDIGYVKGEAETRRTVAWLSPDGKTQPLFTKPELYRNPRLSPDGTRLAYGIGPTAGRMLWVHDFRRDVSTRAVSDKDPQGGAVWSPDGKYLVFRVGDTLGWTREGVGGQAHRGPQYRTTFFPWSFSADGNWVGFNRLGKDMRGDLFRIRVEASERGLAFGAEELLLEEPASQTAPTISPDGQWIAYLSRETGSGDIYVMQFQTGQDRGKWRVTDTGAALPVWVNNREIYYQSADDYIMAVPYSASGKTFVPGKPRRWSEQRLLPADPGGVSFDMTAGGKRAIVLLPAEEAKPVTTIHIMLHAPDELRRRLH